MSKVWGVLALLFSSANAFYSEFLKCDPPHKPIGGDYGPKQETYNPGDTILYYCDVDSFIGGNYLRKCEDSGDWTGETPVCDSPSAFSSTTQTSTAEEGSTADYASDLDKNTCSSTRGAVGDEWYGIFLKPGELIRVMLYLPIGPISFQVILVKANGQEVICGAQSLNIDRHDWTFQNCPGPNNVGATGVKIRSLSNDPIRICEIQAYVLTSPKCTDPHMRIENGHLELSRTMAVLKCDRNFLQGKITEINCSREGVWQRRNLHCKERDWEPEIPNNSNRPVNPDIEREKICASDDSP